MVDVWCLLYHPSCYDHIPSIYVGVSNIRFDWFEERKSLLLVPVFLHMKATRSLSLNTYDFEFVQTTLPETDLKKKLFKFTTRNHFQIHLVLLNFFSTNAQFNALSISKMDMKCWVVKVRVILLFRERFYFDRLCRKTFRFLFCRIIKFKSVS